MKFGPFFLTLIRVVATLALLLVTACGGGSGSGDTSAQGSVAVLMTDAPSDDFSAINVTVSRIDLLYDGGAGSETLFTGSATFNLLSMENFSNLFSVSDGIPAREYDTIRLFLTQVELVEAVTGNLYYPSLSGGGKLDLKPDAPFFVEAGQRLVLEIDMDARKSVHITSGGGGYRFRPVVFVNVGVEAVRNLVQLYGVVTSVDGDTAMVCRLDGAIVTEDCVTVVLSDAGSVFNPDGSSGGFLDLDVNDVLMVTGEFDAADASVLVADVIELDDDTLYASVFGTVLSDAAGDVFTFEVDPEEDFPLDEVTVQLQDGTKVFGADGQEVDASAIVTGLRAEVSGVLSGADTLLAQWVKLSEPAGAELDVLSGQILFKEGSEIYIATDAGTRCVLLLPDVQVQLVTESADGSVSQVGSISDLLSGRDMDAYGTDAGFCFEAQEIVVFATF